MRTPFRVFSLIFFLAFSSSLYAANGQYGPAEEARTPTFLGGKRKSVNAEKIAIFGSGQRQPLWVNCKKTWSGISASHALASPVRVLTPPSGIASQEKWVSWLFFLRTKELAGLEREGGMHSLRHSFATHLIARGFNDRTVQELLGHKHLATTQIYIHLARGTILSKVQNLDLLDYKSLRD